MLAPTEGCMVLQAAKIMRNRHYSGAQCQDLVSEMQAYKSSSPPFNAPLCNVAAFRPKLWWQGIDPKLTIVHLAVFLYDIVPHAATVERLFILCADNMVIIEKIVSRCKQFLQLCTRHWMCK